MFTGGGGAASDSRFLGGCAARNDIGVIFYFARGNHSTVDQAHSYFGVALAGGDAFGESFFDLAQVGGG